MSTDQKLDEIAVENFRTYLRIPSVQPEVNYDQCAEFMKKQATSLGLPIKIIELSPRKPIIVISWEGTKPEEPSILLNGHMDVVPVFSDQWIHPPFEAHMDEKGNIFGRGSQDMKSVTIQHIEAIRRLKLNGVRFRRTIHVSLVPDEEIGGHMGMKEFVRTKEFENLKIGFALDEGDSSAGNKFLVSYGEKTWFQIWIHCPGNPGHGSVLLDNTPGEKLRFIIDKFMDLRQAEKMKLNNSQVTNGDVISVNLTMIKGGVQVNVVPDEFSVAFDIRIPPGVNHEELENTIKQWCQEAGEGVYYTIINKDPPIENTKLNDNIYWDTFKNACDNCHLELDLYIEPGVTDARYLRSIGIPALGFSPINNTPPLAHASNEFLNKNVFLRGIKIFMKIITDLASL